MCGQIAGEPKEPLAVKVETDRISAEDVNFPEKIASMVPAPIPDVSVRHIEIPQASLPRDTEKLTQIAPTPAAMESLSLSPRGIVPAAEGEADASGKADEMQPSISPEPAMPPIPRITSREVTQVAILKPRTGFDLAPASDTTVGNEQRAIVSESQGRETLVPGATRSMPLISEVKSEQRVTVQIGSLEVRAVAPLPRAAEPAPRSAPPTPSPAGFDSFARLRSYAPWLP